MTWGLVITALTLGLRHGVDWDHIAAIADLSSTADSRRRGFVLSLVYAVGHAVVVFALGVAAIVFGANLPAGADVWMGRVVGLTLITMGVWVVYDLVKHRRDFRLRSRWIIILRGTFAGLRRVRDASMRRRIVVRHDHHHDHAEAPAHDDAMAHDHAHIVASVYELAVDPVTAAARIDRGRRSNDRPPPSSFVRRHRHGHHHELSLGEAAQPPGNGTAAGIGVLHGIGFESPTQIAIFVASTSIVGASGGLVLLSAWVAGLLIANSVLAALAGYGLLHAERNFVIYAVIAVAVALASLGMGILLVMGIDLLPAIST